MWPLEPATITGAPGSVSPMRSSAPTFRRARYQVVGTRRPRCMSLATSAPPPAVKEPAIAQLLLPTSPAKSSPARIDRARGASRTAARTFSSSALGIAAHSSNAKNPSTPAASFGASHEDRGEYRKHVSLFQPEAVTRPPARASTSRRSCSRRKPEYCRSHHMAWTTRIVSSSRHAAGRERSTQYSQGRLRRLARPAFTPLAYADTNARCPGVA